MKKIMSLVLCLAMLLTAALAQAEETVFDELSRLAWSFASGVGAWSTELRILADGSFSGEYHDSDMGDAADSYPNGTVYLCDFTGRMSVAGQTEDGRTILRVDELKKDEGRPAESIEDGIRYVAADPYGLSEGDEMILYRPGTPIAELPEEMVFWAHAMSAQDDPQAALECWLLTSEANESGFTGYEAPDGALLPNPWQDLATAEELLKTSGQTFGVPEGAQNVIYRYLPDEDLSEMQFTLDGDEYCARIEPAALEPGQLMNISGIYYEWENEEAVKVSYCEGTLGIAKTGSEEWVELCLWYDIVPGIMYSLSVWTPDPDGLDLTAVAEMVFIPAQGDA